MTEEVLTGEIVKAGRPTKFDPDMIKTMLDAKDQGASDTQVMKILGVCRDTFYRWLRENPEFKDAHSYAKVAEEVHWDRVGEFGIMNPKAINGTLYVAYMKRRFPKTWGATDQTNINTGNSINIGNLTVNNLKSLSSEELEEEIQKRFDLMKNSDPALIEKLVNKKLDT